MKLLIIAATKHELAPLFSKNVMQTIAHNNGIITMQTNWNRTFDVLITGVGMQSTIFELTKTLLTNSYSLVIQAGIGGAFNRNLGIGDVVAIHSDRFAQSGAEDDLDFIDIFELGLIDPGKSPYVNGWLTPNILPQIEMLNLPTCKAITVETVLGSEASIARYSTKYHPDVESMEGAAAFFACMQLHVPCAQIRAISNYVEKRNKANWNTGLAVEQLNKKLLSLINLLIK